MAEQRPLPEVVGNLSHYMIGAAADDVAVFIKRPLPKAEALSLAAFIVATVDPEGTEFARYLEAVNNL